MKFIYKYKSPNFNHRIKGTSVNYIILHYTALNNDIKALKHLCDKKNKVSSHFLINKSGKIYYLVKTFYRAWHAGKSFWKGYSDINSSNVQLLLETVEEQSEIDKKRAEQSLEKAQKQISDRSVDLDRAQRSIQKAKNRLKILNK